MEKMKPVKGHCNAVFESKYKKQNQETDNVLQCLILINLSQNIKAMRKRALARVDSSCRGRL